RGVRTLWQRRRSIRILYPAGRVVTVPVGFSVLEASRVAGIPHASVCGGRGRCSTCRVRVVRGLAALPPASEAEPRPLAALGGAIQRAGGIPNQFTGDGVMALFGIETRAELGCRQAVAAAREIVQGLAALNRELGEELQVPLQIGIGIHAGPAIVGRMGYGEGVY